MNKTKKPKLSGFCIPFSKTKKGTARRWKEMFEINRHVY